MTYDDIFGEINALKTILRDTDYEIVKLAEIIAYATTPEEWQTLRSEWMEEHGDLVANRRAWRNRINELEAALDEIEMR